VLHVILCLRVRVSRPMTKPPGDSKNDTEGLTVKHSGNKRQSTYTTRRLNCQNCFILCTLSPVYFCILPLCIALSATSLYVRDTEGSLHGFLSKSAYQKHFLQMDSQENRYRILRLRCKQQIDPNFIVYV